jgi:hypothetical protein
MDGIREKYYGGESHSKEAFEELYALVHAIEVSFFSIG